MVSVTPIYKRLIQAGIAGFIINSIMISFLTRSKVIGCIAIILTVIGIGYIIISIKNGMTSKHRVPTRR